MHKEYWVAISLYLAAVLATALPFLGIISIDTHLDYLTLKFLHIVAVMLVVSGLLGQLIAFLVMQRSGVINSDTIGYLSYVDYLTPIGLIVISFFGHAMTSHYGPVWQTDWIYESSFGLSIYALISLIITLIFRSKRFYMEGGNSNPAGVYISVGSGLLIYGLITGIMVFKTVPLPSAHYFTPITKYFLSL